ncbi:unnamed protein product, partial [Adineta ricciae]
MCSSEDEIMEITNVLSSSDNVSNSFKTVALDKAISLSPKAGSNNIVTQTSSPSATRSNKRYHSKFKKEWLSNSFFSTFLRECKTDQTKAMCIVCNIQFSIQNSGIGDINHHIRTKKHQDCLKSNEANPTHRIDKSLNITTSELNKLCAVEGAMVFHTVKHSHSYISHACTIDIIKKCFPDSYTVKNITCDRTKAREIACNVLAPSLTDSLVSELQNVSSFSICYDASNKGNAKMVPFVVQFFSKTGVKHGILEFIEQMHETADGLFTNIKYVLEANELKLNQLVSLGSDNTNVNVGNHHSVFALFEKLLPGVIKGTCYCHVLHNSVKHGHGHLLFDVETALLKIYSHFCRSSVRSQELKRYFDFIDEEQQVILKHIKLRWLSLLRSIERLIGVHSFVKSYFLNLPSDEYPKLLLEFFTSNNGECTLFFLANVLPEVQKANLLLQQNHTTGVSIHRIITSLLRKLKNRLHDDFFGNKVAELLENCPITQAEDLRKSFRLFIRTVIDYIEKYYNDYKSFYQSISIFDELDIEKIEWKSIQQCSTLVTNQTIDLDDLYNDFSHIKSKYIDLKGKFCGIKTQVESFIASNLGQSKYNTASTKHEASLCNDCDQDNLDDSDTNDGEPDANVYKHKKTNNSISIRSDHLWAFLLDGEHVPDLRKLIEFAFAIPASNSFCESVFSHMKFLWNNNRNKMNHDLVGAELKIKLNTHLTCTEFYDYLLTKPDILKKIRSSDKYSHIAKKKLDDAVVAAIVEDGRSFGDFSKSGVKKFIRLALPNYTPPHRNSISKQLKRLHTKHVRSMIDDLTKLNSISITTDFWSDLTGVSYLVLTGHYITDDFVLNSTTLRFSSFLTRHYSHSIGTEIEKQLVELKLFDKVASITCDAAPNMVKMFDYFSRSDISRIRCQAHLLHLIICNGLCVWSNKKKKNTIDETSIDPEERLSQSLKKVNILDASEANIDQDGNVTDNVDSQKESQEINSQQNNEIDSYDAQGNDEEEDDDDRKSTSSESEDDSLPIYEDNFQIGINTDSNEDEDLASEKPDYRIQLVIEIIDVRTRWNSTYKMLETLNMHRGVINELFQNKTNLNMTKQQLQRLSSYEFSSDCWHTVEMLIKVLKPFYRGTKVLSGTEYSTIGVAFYVYRRLEKEFLSVYRPTDDPLLINMKRCLLKKMIYYDLQDSLQSKVIQFYAYFDPYGMSVMSNNEINLIEYEIKQKLRHQPSATTTPNSNNTSNTNSGSFTTGKKSKKSLIDYFVDTLDGEDAKDNQKPTTTMTKVSNEEFKTYKKSAAQFVSMAVDRYDPLLFWKQHCFVLPNLATLAQKYLASPSTSVKSESAFSISAYYGRKQRARLSSDNLSYSVFLKDKLSNE